MEDKKILFGIFGKQVRMRMGEFVEMVHSCYIKGKDLGYADGNMFFEWPHRIAFNSEYRYPTYKFMQFPGYSILPIDYVKRNNVKKSDYDEVFNLNKADMFYKGSPAIYNIIDGKFTRNHTGFMNYPNIHYFKTGEKPIIKIPKDKLKKPYILIHTRLANWSEYRNPKIESYHKILDLLEPYRDTYEIWQTGEKCKSVEKRCDNTVPPHPEDINKFLRIVNNSSMIIGCNSGPNTAGDMFNIPYVELDVPIKRNGRPTEATLEGWKLKSDIGNSYRDYRIRGEDLLQLWQNELDEEKFLNFCRRNL